jgi:hypothetical protein
VRTYFGLATFLCVVHLDLVSVVAAGSSRSVPGHIPARAFVRSSSAAVLFLPLKLFLAPVFVCLFSIRCTPELSFICR